MVNEENKRKLTNKEEREKPLGRKNICPEGEGGGGDMIQVHNRQVLKLENALKCVERSLIQKGNISSTFHINCDNG